MVAFIAIMAIICYNKAVLAAQKVEVIKKMWND